MLRKSTGLHRQSGEHCPDGPPIFRVTLLYSGRGRRCGDPCFGNTEKWGRLPPARPFHTRGVTQKKDRGALPRRETAFPWLESQSSESAPLKPWRVRSITESSHHFCTIDVSARMVAPRQFESAQYQHKRTNLFPWRRRLSASPCEGEGRWCKSNRGLHFPESKQQYTAIGFHSDKAS